MKLLARLATAVLVTAGLGFAMPAAPASAAACSGTTGVTVVVDFKALGGGVQQSCDSSGGGKSATDLFSSNGFALSYVQRQPGFVCRISGKPANDPCVNTPPSAAYWGLYWSDGKSGTWVYSSEGASALTVPNGGYVAFAWQSGSRSTPGTTPAVHAAPVPATPAPASPTKSSGSGGTKGGSSGGSSGGSGTQQGTTPGSTSGGSTPSTEPSSSAPTPSESSSDSVTPSARASAQKSAKASAKAGKKAKAPKSTTSSEAAAAAPSDSASPGDDASPVSAEPPSGSDDGLPAWVAPGLIGVLFLVAGSAVVVRRRGSTGT